MDILLFFNVIDVMLYLHVELHRLYILYLLYLDLLINLEYLKLEVIIQLNDFYLMIVRKRFFV